jgi:hypothetical protein
MMDRDPFDLDGMTELQPVLRLTHEQAEAEPHLEAEFLAEFPHGEVIIADDTTCPHCAAAGIRVAEDGQVLDAATGAVVSADGVHVGPVRPGAYRDRRKARRKAERKARRRNR